MPRVAKVEPTKVDVIPQSADSKVKVDASEKPKKRSRKDAVDITVDEVAKSDAVPRAQPPSAAKVQVKDAAPMVMEVATQTAKGDSGCPTCIARRAREAGYARKARARKRAAKAALSATAK